ncbi:hypothetical protein OH492_19740 [Vibrio chagasii]|nr:hypothetical protein [Vibrio chagasii]
MRFSAFAFNSDASSSNSTFIERVLKLIKIQVMLTLMVSLFDVVFKGVNDLSRLQFVAIALGGNGDDTFAVFVE